jgi:hypothetical protein
MAHRNRNPNWRTVTAIAWRTVTGRAIWRTVTAIAWRTVTGTRIWRTVTATAWRTVTGITFGALKLILKLKESLTSKLTETGTT